MFVAPKHALLAKDFPKPQTIIHQHLYERERRPPTPTLSLRELVSAFPGAVLGSIRYHLGLR
jgi:hypothetical protein